MNKKLVIRLLGALLLIEAACMVPSLLIALIYRDPEDAPAIVWSILLMLAFGLPMHLLPRGDTAQNLHAKDGFAVVGLGWIMMSVFGGLPFYFSHLLPTFVDAVFETISGFTTTGASVLTDFERPLHGVIFWRSFTHWIGGMGVLVLTLALLPKLTGRTAHLVRAESPGPTLSKLLPKMGDSAKVLYLIYAALTVVMIAALMICGLSPYDAAVHAIGTAGTGGFSNYGSSVGAFNSLAVEVVITVFMLLFAVNFGLYYRMLLGDWKSVVRNEEIKWFLCIVAAAMLILAVLILPVYHSFGAALRYASFNVATVISTTGYAIADYNLWPAAAKMIIVLLMFIGGCVSSTGGGMKVMRIIILLKAARREVRHTFQPRKVQKIRMDGRGLEEDAVYQIVTFSVVYMLLVLFGAFLVSLDGHFDLETNLTAALTCVSNVGPGLGAVGPAGSFSGYSPYAKVILSLLMLSGRLEMFPMLVLLHPKLWQKF